MMFHIVNVKWNIYNKRTHAGCRDSTSRAQQLTYIYPILAADAGFPIYYLSLELSAADQLSVLGDYLHPRYG